MKKISVLFLALFLSATAQAHQLDKVTGLAMPESALAGKDGRVYVSEIGVFGKDGDGLISVIDKQGQRQVFATGLDDPKGLAMIDADLYVADKQRIIKINPQGQTQVFAEAGAFPAVPQFLNDLEADTQGNLYVSDSGDLQGGGGAIYKIDRQGKVSVVINAAKDKRIAAPNGLLMGRTPNCIMLVDFASGVFYRYDMKKDELIEEASGFGGGDGIVQTSNGDYYISDWKGGKVFRVQLQSKQPAKVTLVQDGFQAAADIALSADGHALLVPDMKAGELVVYGLHH